MIEQRLISDTQNFCKIYLNFFKPYLLYSFETVKSNAPIKQQFACQKVISWFKKGIRSPTSINPRIVKSKPNELNIHEEQSAIIQSKDHKHVKHIKLTAKFYDLDQ